MNEHLKYLTSLSKYQFIENGNEQPLFEEFLTR